MSKRCPRSIVNVKRWYWARLLFFSTRTAVFSTPRGSACSVWTSTWSSSLIRFGQSWPRRAQAPVLLCHDTGQDQVHILTNQRRALKSFYYRKSIVDARTFHLNHIDTVVTDAPNSYCFSPVVAFTAFRWLIKIYMYIFYLLYLHD